jgi:hypothetical protein
MKPGYLGDCLDFYKRWFLAEFFPRERLDAVPMLTEPWPSPVDKALYSALVGVQVIQDAIVPNAAERSAYFQVLGQSGHEAKDVFLDPDTGLRLGPRPRRRRFDEYHFGHELPEFILPIGSKRVAVIYDQSIARGSEAEEYADLKMQVLRGMGLSAFAYCAQVAMVVVSRDTGRINTLHQHAQGLAHLPQDRVLVV